ncbi:MAG: glycosyltransferase [bacterium]
MKIAVVNNEQQDFSGKPIEWEGREFHYTAAGFEDVVSGLWTRGCDVRIDSEALGRMVAETQQADAVYCESPEAFLLWFVFSRRGLRPVPFVIEDEHLLQSVTRLARWVEAVYGCKALEEFLTDRRNVWLHHAAAHRPKYLSAGIAPERLIRLPCSSYLINLVSPELYRELKRGKRRPRKEIEEAFAGSFLCAGFNRRDVAAFAEATRGLPHKIRVIGPRDPQAARINRNIQWFDFMPQADYIDALSAAAAVVVPLLYDEFSGGENTITFSMALGKPVIATGTAAVREIITDGKTGLLVPVNGAGAIRTAIETLAADDKLRKRIGAAAKKAEIAIAENCREALVEAFSKIAV